MKEPAPPTTAFSRPALAALLLVALVLSALWLSSGGAHDQRDPVPEGVGVDEQLGARLPTELTFRDQTGQSVRLSRYFTGSPVLLTLNYYACPTLCPLVFRNLVRTMGEMPGLALGRDFRIVTVSIDPEETRARAAEKSRQTYAMLGSTPDPGSSWPFLMGSRGSIESLTRRVGVHYSAVGKSDFAHPNVIIVVTPEGKVSRYLYGLELPARDLKLALIEASGGRIGSSQLLNRALMYCFRYDSAGREYVLLASRLVTALMLLVLILTTGLIALLWRRERRERAALKAPPPSQGGAGGGWGDPG